MSPETTIEKIRKAPAATSVHHIVRASSRTQHRGTHTRTPSSRATRPISLQVPANRPDQRSASPQLKQPSSTSTVRRGGLSTASLSTSTTKSDARYDRKDHRGPGVASPRASEPTEFFGASPCSRPIWGEVLGMRGRSRDSSSSLTSIRDAVSGRNKPKTATRSECPRPPVGLPNRKHSFIS
jgi:hypothetical protein